MYRLHLLLAAFISFSSSAIATLITVDETCTLVDAIHAANEDAARGGCPAGGGPDEIWLTSDVEVSEVFEVHSDAPVGLPPIESDITVDGRGFSIRRPPGTDLLHFFTVVGSEAHLTVANLALVNSNAGSWIYNFNRRAAIRGGILTVVNSGIFRTAGPATGPLGYNTKPLTIRNSTISGNTSAGVTGFWTGWPKYFGQDVYIQHSTVSYNRGPGVSAGAATIVGSTIHDNDGPGVLTPWGVVLNSTISGNGADGVTRGTDSVHSTIIGNAHRGIRGGMDYYLTDPAVVKNSIIAENGTDCGGNSRLDFRVGNLTSDDSCPNGADRVRGVDAHLADNGGPTMTHALPDGSNAIDAGGNCTLWLFGNNPIATDQRGVHRNAEACDSGSVEFGDPGFELETQGLCPGPMTIVARGAEPFSSIEVVASPRLGVAPISRDCPGVHYGLDAPRTIATLRTDAEGEGSVAIDLPRRSCGAPLQAADLDSCSLSEMATVGRPPVAPPCSIPAPCGLKRAIHGNLFPPFEPPFEPPGIGDEYLVGDWDGDGCDNVALRIGNLIAMDINFDLETDIKFRYGTGDGEDQYLVGDWNNDGCDDIAVRRGDNILLNIDGDGMHEAIVTVGAGVDADEYLIGDILGLGKDAILYRTDATVGWDLRPWDGIEDGTTTFGAGEEEDQYLIGNWSDDASPAQTLAVRRGNEISMNYDLDDEPDFVQTFGLGDEDQYLVGDWDGDGRDNLAVRRGGVIEMDTDFDDEPDISMTFGEGTDD